MREPSLRPERSASANSATSAFFLRSVFYLKGVFCQPEARQKYIISLAMPSCILFQLSRKRIAEVPVNAVKPTDIHRFCIQREHLSRLIIVMALSMEQNSNYFVMSMPCRMNRLFTIWVNGKSSYIQYLCRIVKIEHLYYACNLNVDISIDCVFKKSVLLGDTTSSTKLR